MALDKQGLERSFDAGVAYGREQKKQDEDAGTPSLRNIWALVADKFSADASFAVNVFPGSVMITSQNCEKTLTVSENGNGTFSIDTVGREKISDLAAPPSEVLASLGRYYGRYGR